MKLEDIFAMGAILSISIDIPSLGVPLTHLFILLLFFFNILNLLAKKDFRINKYLFMFTLFVLVNSILPSRISLNYLKHVMGMLVYFFSYYSYLSLNKNRIKKIMYNYIKISQLFACLGIFQFLGFVFKLNFLYDYSYLGITSRVSTSGEMLRVFSIFSEPAAFGVVLFPAAIIAIKNLIILKRKKLIDIVVISCMLLTFSFIPYILLFACTLYFFKLKYGLSIKYILISIFLAITVVVLIVKNDNLNEKLRYFNLDRGELLSGGGASAYAIISDILVNYEAFKSNPIYGTGIGRYEENYNSFIFKYFDTSAEIATLRMKKDSIMYPKLLGELGVIGFLLIFLLFREGKKDNKGYDFLKIFWIGNLIIMLRSGSYFSPVNLFFINYYLVKKE